MATCTICTHPQRHAIEKSIIDGIPNRRLAGQHGVSEIAIRRHKANHLAPGLAIASPSPAPIPQPVVEHAQASIAGDQAHAIDIIQQLVRQIERVNKLSDAVDEWLTDPDDPSRYSIDPRAEDVHVIYRERAGEVAEGIPFYGPRKKERLSQLLARLDGQQLEIEATETKYADPRELLIKASDGLKGQLGLLLTILERLYNAREVETFMAAVLEAIDEVAPDVRAAITDNLRRRQPLRRLSGSPRA